MTSDEYLYFWDRKTRKNHLLVKQELNEYRIYCGDGVRFAAPLLSLFLSVPKDGPFEPGNPSWCPACRERLREVQALEALAGV